MAEWTWFGIDLLLAFQSAGDWLHWPMELLSFLGNEEFYLLVLPVLYWSIDSRLGLRIGLLLMISGGLNNILKYSFHLPRPYWVDERVIAFSSETSFGLPSGHSQNAAAIWGSIPAAIRKEWSTIIFGALIILIGLSRIYLGVHFPVDVLTGWLVGLLLLWVMLILEKPVLGWLAGQNLANRLLAAFGVSLVLALLGSGAALLTTATWQMPAEWQSMALLAHPDEPVAPLAVEGMFTTSGAFFGLAAGAIILQAMGGYQTKGTLLQHVLRFLIGLVGVLLLWRGLGVLLPDGENLPAYVLRYLRYTLIGLWVIWLAPWIYIRLRLASKPEPAPRAG